MPDLYSNMLDLLFDVPAPWRRALFMTYTFDSGFFSESIEPFLRKGGSPKALILMDNRQYASTKLTPLGGAVGRIILDRFPSGQLFHPKLYLLVGNGEYRCAISSANLTKSGLYRNRELFTIYDQNTCDIESLLNFLEAVSNRMLIGSGGRMLLDEVVAELKPFMNNLPPALRRIEFGGLKKQNLLDKAIDALDGQTIKKVVIMSPYFDSPDKFDESMIAEWLAKGVKVVICVPVDTLYSSIPDEQIQKLKKKYPRNLTLLGLKTDRRKLLHAKFIVLMGSSRTVMMSGSANFTKAALQGKNVELCDLSVLKRSQAEVYLRALLKDAKEIGSDAMPKRNQQHQTSFSGLTGFILAAIASVKEDQLIIYLDRPYDTFKCRMELWTFVINGTKSESSIHAISDKQIEIKNISRYLRLEDGMWNGGVIEILLPDEIGSDQWVIELKEDEVVDENGDYLEKPTNLESFYLRLFSSPARTSGLQVKHNKSKKGGSGFDSIEDIDAELDIFHRMAMGIQRHFKRLMKDPYTVHNWKRDFLELVEILGKDEIDELQAGLIAGKVMEVFVDCIEKYDGGMASWIDNNSELRASIHNLANIIKISGLPESVPVAVRVGL